MNDNNINKVIRTALYIRVSTEEQVRHGYSLNSQKERLLEYCKVHKYKVINIYADEGKTARSKLKNRKALLQLVEDAKQKKFDRIVFWRLDRWFRNISDYYKIQEILDKYKIDWECTDEEYNTTTSNGRLHLNIKLSIAQNESDQTSDRIKFNFDNMVKNGHAIVGKQGLPLGYMISGEKHNKRVVKDPKTEEITNDMWESIQLTGSIRKTLKYINEKYSLNIYYDSMRHYFMNTKYYGLYRENENYCPAYVDKQTFLKVQSLIKRNVKMNKRHDYIFSGLIRCPLCHHKLAGFTSKSTLSHGRKVSFKYPSYRCNYHYQGQCDYTKRPVESTIEKYLKNHIIEELNRHRLKIQSVLLEKEKKPKIDIKKLETKLCRLNELYLNDRIDKEKYDEEYEKVKTQITSFNQDEEISEDDVNKFNYLLGSDILSIYEKLDNNHKRAFWANIFEYIEIDMDGRYHIYFK